MQGSVITLKFSALLSLFGFIIFAGCTKPLSQDLGGTIQMEIPLQNEFGEYTLQRVQLTQLESLRSMRGDYAEFFLSPKIQPGGLEGSPFEGRFAKMGDLWIARDVMSLTAATIYYHLQELWHLDAAIGAASLKPKRQQVALSAIVDGEDGQLQDNALFEASSRALLFVTYTDTNIPISINSGILAHEHFHSLFYPLVLEPLIQGNFVSTAHAGLYGLSGHAATKASHASTTSASNTSPAENEVLERRKLIYHLLWLKGINEGLADVWGWAYTWDPDFISRSLPSIKTFRTLTVPNEITSFTSGSNMKGTSAIIDRADLAKIPKLITEEAYVLGTEWARFFKQYLEKSLQDSEVTGETHALARKKVLSGIIVSLGQMKNELLALKSLSIEPNSGHSEAKPAGQFYDPANFLKTFSETQANQSEASCLLLSKYLHSLPQTAIKPGPANESTNPPIVTLRNYTCTEVAGQGFQPQL